MRGLTTTLMLTVVFAALAVGQEPGKSRFATDRARNRAAIAARDRRQAALQAEQMAKAQAEYKAMLPYLMEQQRMEMERLSAIERNVALTRMAAAAELQAAAAKRQADNAAYYLYYNRPR